jgi:hypothetical protein
MKPPKRRFRFPGWKQVTLIVYGWHESQPGTLAWVFPSLKAAVRAVRALRNAVKWLIVAGKRDDATNVDEIRRRGLVLLERFA